MERRIGSRFYSSENDCNYRVVRGRYNNCSGCAFAEWYENGDGECFKPDEAGECVAEYRDDGNDVIFKEA